MTARPYLMCALFLLVSATPGCGEDHGAAVKGGTPEQAVVGDRGGRGVAAPARVPRREESGGDTAVAAAAGDGPGRGDGGGGPSGGDVPDTPVVAAAPGRSMEQPERGTPVLMAAAAIGAGAPVPAQPAGSGTAAPQQPGGNAAGTPDADDEDTGEDEKGSGKGDIQGQIDALKKELERLQKEADARKQLEITEEEKAKKGEEILSSVGREYTLLKKGTLGLEYDFTYAYVSSDVLKNAATVEQQSNHTLVNAVFIEYALRDNLTLNASIPFIYKYDKVGSDNASSVTGLGDVSFGAQYQPFKAGGEWPTTILNVGLSIPLGTSPYTIVPGQGQPTGSGFYSATAGATLSKTIDPLVAFGSLSYTYNFDADGLDQNWTDGRDLTKVVPGNSIGGVLGFAYALSYKASLNLSYQMTYNFGTEYRFSNASTFNNGSWVSSVFGIGTGWRITPSRSVTLKLGIGLTSNDPDFTFSVRVPFEF